MGKKITFKPRKPGAIPWAMLIKGLPYLIVAKTSPESVSSNKQITYAEIQVPGGGHGIPKFGSMASRQISFSIRIAEFNDELGVTNSLQPFESLRNPGLGVLPTTLNPAPFTPNPSVYYIYGTGDVIFQHYFVTQCDFTCTYPNKLGYPQVVDVAFTLVLDESGNLNKAENGARAVLGIVSSVKSVLDLFGSGNPYKARKKILGGLF